MVLTKIGASLAGSAHTITVTQGSHGFVSNDRGKAVKMTDASGTPTYALATANTVANADAIGIITQVINATTFIIALSGRITVDAAIITYGGSPVAGTVLFLPTASALGVANSVQNSGHLTPTEPSGANEVSKPMAVVTVAGSEIVMLQQRGEVITTGAVSIADDSIVEAKLDVSNGPSNGLFLQAQSGGGGLTWAAAGGGGAVVREGGNTVEVETTSTSDFDLLTASSLDIGATSPLTILVNTRKTVSSNNGGTKIGIKLTIVQKRFMNFVTVIK